MKLIEIIYRLELCNLNKELNIKLIKSQWKLLLRKYHPDFNVGKGRDEYYKIKTQKLNEAYESAVKDFQYLVKKLQDIKLIKKQTIDLSKKKYYIVEGIEGKELFINDLIFYPFDILENNLLTIEGELISSIKQFENFIINEEIMIKKREELKKKAEEKRKEEEQRRREEEAKKRAEEKRKEEERRRKEEEKRREEERKRQEQEEKERKRQQEILKKINYQQNIKIKEQCKNYLNTSYNERIFSLKRNIELIKEEIKELEIIKEEMKKLKTNRKVLENDISVLKIKYEKIKVSEEKIYEEYLRKIKIKEERTEKIKDLSQILNKNIKYKMNNERLIIKLKNKIVLTSIICLIFFVTNLKIMEYKMNNKTYSKTVGMYRNEIVEKDGKKIIEKKYITFLNRLFSTKEFFYENENLIQTLEKKYDEESEKLQYIINTDIKNSEKIIEEYSLVTGKIISKKIIKPDNIILEKKYDEKSGNLIFKSEKKEGKEETIEFANGVIKNRRIIIPKIGSKFIKYNDNRSEIQIKYNNGYIENYNCIDNLKIGKYVLETPNGKVETNFEKGKLVGNAYFLLNNNEEIKFLYQNEKPVSYFFWKNQFYSLNDEAEINTNFFNIKRENGDIVLTKERERVILSDEDNKILARGIINLNKYFQIKDVSFDKLGNLKEYFTIFDNYILQVIYNENGTRNLIFNEKGDDLYLSLNEVKDTNSIKKEEIMMNGLPNQEKELIFLEIAFFIIENESKYIKKFTDNLIIILHEFYDLEEIYKIYEEFYNNKNKNFKETKIFRLDN